MACCASTGSTSCTLAKGLGPRAAQEHRAGRPPRVPGARGPCRPVQPMDVCEWSLTLKAGPGGIEDRPPTGPLRR